MPCRLPIVLLTVALLGLAGCGSDDETEEAGSAVASDATAPAEAAVDEAIARRVEELIPIARQPQLGKSRKESLRIADAQAELLTVAAENPAAIEPLLAALERPDYELILDMHSFFIQLGKPGSEKAIGEALQRLEPSPENNPIVFAYYGSGNRKLIAAAGKWAADNGYEFSGSPTPLAGGWGSAGVYGPPGVPPGVPGP